MGEEIKRAVREERDRRFRKEAGEELFDAWHKMGDHTRKIDCLMESRAGGYWKRKVLELLPAELAAELEENRASTKKHRMPTREVMEGSVAQGRAGDGLPVVRVRQGRIEDIRTNYWCKERHGCL